MTSKVISIIYVFISFTIFCDKPEQTRPILHVTLQFVPLFVYMCSSQSIGTQWPSGPLRSKFIPVPNNRICFSVSYLSSACNIVYLLYNFLALFPKTDFGIKYIKYIKVKILVNIDGQYIYFPLTY